MFVPGGVVVREYFQWLRIKIPCNLAVVVGPELSYEPDSGSEQLHEILIFCSYSIEKLFSDGRLTPMPLHGRSTNLRCCFVRKSFLNSILQDKKTVLQDKCLVTQDKSHDE